MPEARNGRIDRKSHAFDLPEASRLEPTAAGIRAQVLAGFHLPRGVDFPLPGNRDRSDLEARILCSVPHGLRHIAG